MIDIQIPKINEFDTSQVQQLVSDFKNLRNFNDIAQWDKRISEEIERIRFVIMSIEAKQLQINQGIEQARRNHLAQPFLVRLFSTQREERQLTAEQARLAREKTLLEKLADQLEAAVDFTPDSPEDLKELMKECRLRKKELQAEKKAINSQMTAIRVEARQKTAITIQGKYGKWDRRRIRLDKEAALRPYEDHKAALERQILKLDRAIAWLERFK